MLLRANLTRIHTLLLLFHLSGLSLSHPRSSRVILPCTTGNCTDLICSAFISTLTMSKHPLSAELLRPSRTHSSPWTCTLPHLQHLPLNALLPLPPLSLRTPSLSEANCSVVVCFTCCTCVACSSSVEYNHHVCNRREEKHPNLSAINAPDRIGSTTDNIETCFCVATGSYS